MKTALQIKASDLAGYRRTALSPKKRSSSEIRARRLRAWRVARKAAKLLKADFGIVKVAVFGSLIHPGLFHAKSDVDLAVWGMDERKYYRAVSLLLDIDPSISVDLVCTEDARPALKKVIEKEGRQL
jgi:predicted nucleotidyltransferase